MSEPAGNPDTATIEITTVGHDRAVVHRGAEVFRFDGLEPGTTQPVDVGGEQIPVTTLPRPAGALRCRFATVNDVHFGETECGLIEGFDIGPVLSAAPGEAPYPETMNRSAVAEIAAIEPAAVVAKGDLTTHGTDDEYQAFLDCYASTFGDTLTHVRGNHDAYQHQTYADDPTQLVTLPGVVLAVLDTAIPGASTGQVRRAQLDWLDAVAEDATDPVLVFGHHHPWDPASNERPDGYFGINPDDSEALVATMARHASLRGYFAGHTHRNRVRRFAASGDVVHVEVACVKDFPGAWAEYEVWDGGIVQLVHRISTPEALDWTERTRAMFAGAYAGYSFGDLDDRCFVLPT